MFFGTGHDQEGRRGLNEVVPGTSVFPLSESGMSRNFWGRIKGAKNRFALQPQAGPDLSPEDTLFPLLPLEACCMGRRVPMLFPKGLNIKLQLVSCPFICNLCKKHNFSSYLEKGEGDGAGNASFP